MTAIPILTVRLDPNLFLAMTATISDATELNKIAEIIKDVSASMTLKIILIKPATSITNRSTELSATPFGPVIKTPGTPDSAKFLAALAKT